MPKSPISGEALQKALQHAISPVSDAELLALTIRTHMQGDIE